mmetsp:Transcript_4577/g.7864  ORF Transcript_4577/g.7864 Transcript_4577/m.7864 type:complete len:84 (+) Transcript_4577:425-676(+)
MKAYMYPRGNQFHRRGLDLSIPDHSSSFKIIITQKLERKILRSNSTPSNGRYTKLITCAINNNIATRVVIILSNRNILWENVR